MTAGDLMSKDIRGVVSLRKSLPDMGIRGVIERFKGARDIKEYVAQFVVPASFHDPEKLSRAFAQELGKDNVRSVSIRGQVGELVVSAEGRRRLEAMAKARKITKRKVIEAIVSAEVK